jgi:hypothetical protein
MSYPDTPSDERLERAKSLARIYRLPRRAYPNGPYMPLTDDDILIAEALELYVQEFSCYS